MSKSVSDIFGMVTTRGATWGVTQEGLEEFASFLNSRTKLRQFLSESAVNNSIDYDNVDAPASFLEALFNTQGEQARDLFVKAMMNHEVIDKLMLGGKRNWLESRLDKLSDDQVVKILCVPNNLERIGLEYSNPLRSWMIQKIEELDNDQITEILSTRGAIKTFSGEKTILWLTKTLDKLDQDQATKVLCAHQAVPQLLEFWRNDHLVLRKLGTLDLDQAAKILSSPGVSRALIDAGHEDWLKEKQAAIRASKAGSVAPAIHGPQ